MSAPAGCEAEAIRPEELPPLPDWLWCVRVSCACDVDDASTRSCFSEFAEAAAAPASAGVDCE